VTPHPHDKQNVGPPTRPSTDGLMTAPVASHPLPSERENVLWGRARPGKRICFLLPWEREKHVLGAQACVPSACGGLPHKKSFFLLPGEKVLRYEADEGSLPPPRPPAAYDAQPRVGRITAKGIVPRLVARTRFVGPRFFRPLQRKAVDLEAQVRATLLIPVRAGLARHPGDWRWSSVNVEAARGQRNNGRAAI
jgi:hypothetical protein